MNSSEKMDYLNYKIDGLNNLMKEILINEYKELSIKNNELNYLSYENIFLQKIFLNTNTFLNIYRNKTSLIVFEKKILDVHSLNNILRNIMETAVLYRNIYKQDKEDIKELKFLIWQYRSLFKVTRETYKIKDKKIYSDNSIHLSEVKRLIEESLLFQQLKNPKDIFNRHNKDKYLCEIKSLKISFLNTSEVIKQYYIKFKEGELLYGYFSQYTHPSFQSFNELGTNHSESLESDWYKIFLSSFNSLIFTLCHFLWDYIGDKDLSYISDNALLEEIKELNIKEFT